MEAHRPCFRAAGGTKQVFLNATTYCLKRRPQHNVSKVLTFIFSNEISFESKFHANFGWSPNERCARGKLPPPFDHELLGLHPRAVHVASFMRIECDAQFAPHARGLPLLKRCVHKHVCALMRHSKHLVRFAKFGTC